MDDAATGRLPVSQRRSVHVQSSSIMLEAAEQSVGLPSKCEKIKAKPSPLLQRQSGAYEATDRSSAIDRVGEESLGEGDPVRGHSINVRATAFCAVTQ